MTEPSTGRRIAIIGPGAIGSLFAFALSRAGHEVTLVARNQRLEQLRADGAVVTVKGERAVVRAVPALPEEPFDVILVTLFAAQVDAVLPALRAHTAPVLFMFNAFSGHETLRDAVGPERFGWAFPATISAVVEGRLDVKMDPRTLRLFQITTLGALPGFTPAWLAPWAAIFRDAGIPATVEPDMISWLRTHAVLMAPLMAAGVRALQGPLRFSAAMELARGSTAGFRLLRRLGHPVTPSSLAVLRWLPNWLYASALWVFARTAGGRAAASVTGPAEPRFLVDQMLALASDERSALERLLP